MVSTTNSYKLEYLLGLIYYEKPTQLASVLPEGKIASISTIDKYPKEEKKIQSELIMNAKEGLKTMYQYEETSGVPLVGWIDTGLFPTKEHSDIFIRFFEKNFPNNPKYIEKVPMDVHGGFVYFKYHFNIDIMTYSEIKRAHKSLSGLFNERFNLKDNYSYEPDCFESILTTYKNKTDKTPLLYLNHDKLIVERY